MLLGYVSDEKYVALADVLLKLDVHPIVQEHFPPDYRTVREMLHEKIAYFGDFLCNRRCPPAQVRGITTNGAAQSGGPRAIPVSSLWWPTGIAPPHAPLVAARAGGPAPAVPGPELPARRGVTARRTRTYRV